MSTKVQRSIRFRRAAAAAGALLIGAAGLLPVPAAAAAEESLPVMVILDASGSMLNDDAPGLRIDAAKKAVKNLIDTVPADTQMGLMVYGTGTDSSPAAETAGCQDIKTLAPVGDLDKESLKDKVDDIEASGYTPVGAALKAADESMKSLEGPRSIVLVSDGIDTCAPPAACDVAHELADKGLDLTVHSIGFKVDSKARAELECIAEATGGTYADAQDAEALNDELTIQAKRALKTYQVGGTPVSGGKELVDATVLQPGQYVDQLPSSESLLEPDPGAARYFRVHLEPGERVHFAASAIRPQDNAAAPIDNDWHDLRVDPFTDAGEDCGTGVRDYNSAANLLGGPPTAVFSSPAMGSEEEGCYSADYTGDVYFQVVRKGGDDDATLPVELSVLIEPASDATSLPAAYDEVQPVKAPQLEADAPTIEPGYSYGTATEITEGSHSAALVPNELHIYKVDLDYGQQLAVRLQLGNYELNGLGIGLQLNAATPVRTAVDFAEEGGGYRKGIHRSIASGGSTLDATFAAPVRFNNRDSQDEKITTLFAAGAYYILVSSDAHGQDEYDAEIPYTLALDISGSPEGGPLLASVASQPADPVATETATSGDPAQTLDAPDLAGGSATREGSNSLVLPWVLGGAGTVLLAAAGSVLLVLRKRRNSPGD